MTSDSYKSTQNERLIEFQLAKLFHIQSHSPIELDSKLSVIHIGKPNEKLMPDVDVSGLPNSDIVSRVHADIRKEGNVYFIEDVGSANGTYLNFSLLIPGKRYPLNAGDRISLGKGDSVTFIFGIF